MIFIDTLHRFVDGIISHLPLINQILEVINPLIWIWLWWALFRLWKQTLSTTFKEVFSNYGEVKYELSRRTTELRFEIDRINNQLAKLKEKNERHGGNPNKNSRPGK